MKVVIAPKYRAFKRDAIKQEKQFSWFIIETLALPNPTVWLLTGYSVPYRFAMRPSVFNHPMYHGLAPTKILIPSVFKIL